MPSERRAPHNASWEPQACRLPIVGMMGAVVMLIGLAVLMPITQLIQLVT